MKTKKEEAGAKVIILAVNVREVTFAILGEGPGIIHNRMNEKARHELLMPARKKNAAERLINLKHNPSDEFVSSLYRLRTDDFPTRLYVPGRMFLKALASAARDIPGSASKAQVLRLITIPSIIPIYGLPRLHMATVRQSGIQRTPDVRTRGALPRWACYLTVRYIADLIDESNLANLVAGAGLMAGVGDFRKEGGGDYGNFQPVDTENEEFQNLIKTAGRDAQDAAIKAAIPYDDESEELLLWFNEEFRKRKELKPAAQRAEKNGEAALAA